jgi:hypothetical protein
MARAAPFTRQAVIEATELGLNDVAINTATDATAFNCAGYNQLTIEVSYTQSAGTGIEFYLHTVDGSDTEFPLQSGSTSAGTETLTDRKITKAMASSDTFAYNRPINCTELMIANVLATGSPDANDKVTMRVILGVV